MATTLFGQLAIVVTVSLLAAAGAVGCLSSSDSSPAPGTTPTPDAGQPPTPVLDASGVVTPDAAPTPDAGPPGEDSGPPPFEAGPPDAGPPDAAPATASQVGLVGGGTLSRSAHYVLVGSTGPATAPVLKSSSYQLTGGMAASTQK